MIHGTAKGGWRKIMNMGNNLFHDRIPNGKEKQEDV
jgi:hypothetical protein